jgi:hypothetical protein
MHSTDVSLSHREVDQDMTPEVLQSCRLDGRRSRELEIPYKCCPEFATSDMQVSWCAGWNERDAELKRIELFGPSTMDDEAHRE